MRRMPRRAVKEIRDAWPPCSLGTGWRMTRRVAALTVNIVLARCQAGTTPARCRLMHPAPGAANNAAGKRIPTLSRTWKRHQLRVLLWMQSQEP